MADDLNRPLGLDRDATTRFGRPVAWLPLAFGGLAVIALSLIAFVIITGDRDGGEPFAIARIEQERSLGIPAAPAPVATSAAQDRPIGTLAEARANTSAAEM